MQDGPHMTDAPEYYMVRYVLYEREGFLIWYTNHSDGVLITPDRRVKTFRDVASVFAFSEERSITVRAEGSAEYDLDNLISWLKYSTAEGIDCNDFLNAWNLFEDIARALNIEMNYGEPGDWLQEVYDKLFRGCNLPAMSFPGVVYVPDWSLRNIRTLQIVLGKGLAVFQTFLPSP